jgi:hypothetical protein
LSHWNCSEPFSEEFWSKFFSVAKLAAVQKWRCLGVVHHNIARLP